MSPFLALFAVAVAATAPPPQGQTQVAWLADGNMNFQLDVSFRNKGAGFEGSSKLKIELSRKTALDPGTFAWQSDEKPQTVVYAFPIRVAGDEWPQVLVCASTDWGLDFTIYAIDPWGCRASFSQSLRDDAAIRWRAKNHELTSFTVTDRWDSAGVAKESRLKPGVRWQRVTTYRWSENLDRWTAVRSVWQSWNVNKDKGLGKAVFASERGCSFAYRKGIVGGR